jgi:hypothetical protein
MLTSDGKCIANEEYFGSTSWFKQGCIVCYKQCFGSQSDQRVHYFKDQGEPLFILILGQNEFHDD